MRILMSLALLATIATPALSQTVEETTLGGSVIRLHLLPSLTEEELATLRVVATNDQALSLFLPRGNQGHSAMAISPKEGFIRDGAPVFSAMALSGYPDAAAAAEAATQACEKNRGADSDACVVVLEIAPK